MGAGITRRDYLVGSTSAVAGLVASGAIVRADAVRAAGRGEGAELAAFPSQNPSVVREIVGAAHRDLERVRALLQDSPRLANCAYDWGFGDWETPLGAAAHTGRIQIAELLLEYGARPDIFALATLGRAGAVGAILEAMPALARARGPHGLTLMHHARAGGEGAKAVVEMLAGFAGTDEPYAVAPVGDAGAYCGTYRFGAGAEDVVEVLQEGKDNRLAIRRRGGTSCRLFHQGEHRFHPAGAHDTSVVFAVEADRGVRVTIRTPAPLIDAVRE